MPDETPAPPAPPGGQPPAVPPAAPPGPAPVAMTSDQLKARLDETRTAGATAKEAELLKQLGYKSVDEAAKALADAKKLTDAQLSENERYKKQVEELTPKAERGQRFEALTKTIVDTAFGKLPEAAQKAIDAIAKGDPEQRFQLMALAEAIQPGSGGGAPPPAAPPKSAAPPPAPAPTGQPTKFQEYEAMRAKSSILGDVFYQSNMREIEASRPPA